ncbi:unnamed protein product [Trichogramma brassicae]|uniref:Uncharacterized protein n=1 Tax=Trichogramma brassicae TaxID=86971 RepID=A0A6H5J063_9HYME|nr:unnamed protein product [Trichogramma brassicae]
MFLLYESADGRLRSVRRLALDPPTTLSSRTRARRGTTTTEKATIRSEKETQSSEVVATRFLNRDMYHCSSARATFRSRGLSFVQRGSVYVSRRAEYEIYHCVSDQRILATLCVQVLINYKNQVQLRSNPSFEGPARYAESTSSEAHRKKKHAERLHVREREKTTEGFKILLDAETMSINKKKTMNINGNNSGNGNGGEDDKMKRVDNLSKEFDMTQFHMACVANLSSLVWEFLSRGQDPNCLVPKTGDAPLHLALANGNVRVVELLIKNGANPNLANEQGSTPLHVICTRDNDDDDESIDRFLKMCDDKNITLELDARDKLGRTPLQLAVVHSLPHAVDVLLVRGADIASFEVDLGVSRSCRHPQSRKDGIQTGPKRRAHHHELLRLVQTVGQAGGFRRKLVPKRGVRRKSVQPRDQFVAVALTPDPAEA